MKKWFTSVLSLASLLLIASTTLHAQAVPTATKSGRIQAGAGLLYLNNDYTEKSGQGITGWADYDFAQILHRVEVGAEFEANFGGIRTPQDIGENSYEIGPRFVLYHRAKFQVIGKFMFGRGTITNQLFNQSSSFNIYSIGGGVDYHVARKYNIRANFEEQKWPDFEPHTLSPFGISIGVLYIIR